MSAELDVVIREVAEKLKSAKHIVVLTGAGISAESGLPTFRDAMTGLWAQYRPEELATPEAFAENPKLVWEWYAWRRELVERATPNPAHLALVTLEAYVPKLTLITQNVDGLHQIAGSREVIELHGNIRRSKCALEGKVVTEWAQTDSVPPHCPDCGSFLRPDVVWFGESLPEALLETAIQASANCDVFLSIGTSGTVEPAASLPKIAAQSDATVLYLNREVQTDADPPIYSINGLAGTVLPELVALVTEGR